MTESKQLPLSPCFWLALGLLSWGYLVFSSIIDLCCTTFMLSVWSCFDTICNGGWEALRFSHWKPTSKRREKDAKSVS